jgi:hypothetical protein
MIPGQMRISRTAATAVAVLALTVTLTGVGTGPAGATDDGSPAAPASPACRGAVCRVLVVSLPAVSWADVTSERLPNLERVFADAAIADLATRSVRQRTSPGDGYTALGAGARAIGAGAPGQNFQPAEPYGDSAAAQVFERRTGRALRRGTGALWIPSIVDANDGLPYDAVAGALGSTLREHRVGRSVIANADEDELEPEDLRYHREAALAMMDETGRVPRGRVGPQLLERDPDAPFGLRLDRDAVAAEFREAWNASPRTVVLVEGSDVARAAAYRPRAVPEQRARMRTRALRATDRLVGELLEEVDPARDAVLVVGPYHSARRRELTVAALRAPGIDPGYLRSATTRRTGFVGLVDVAPTILSLLDIERPDAMEGRAFTVREDPDPFAERVRPLVRANRAAVFRDNTIGTATAALVAMTLILAGAALLVLGRGGTRWRLVLELGALGVLGYLVGTFLAGLLPFFRWPGTYYLGFLILVAVAYAVACHLLGRRHPADALLYGLGGMLVLHLLDAFSGARLEFNTVFGYTATIGIRLAGLGNPGSAQACASALLVAALVAWRVPPPAGRRIAIAVLAVTVVAVGGPSWGQDFGGAISAAPAYVLLVILLSGRRVNARIAALLGVILVAVGLAVGFADLARPADSRTHVGRFFEKVGDEGVSGFTTVVGRKASLMLKTFGNTGWVLLVAGVLGTLAYVAWRTDRLRALGRAVPTLPAALVSYAVLVVLTTLLNDSGVAITGMMLAVLLPTLVVLACRTLDGAPTAVLSRDEAERAPARSPA